MNRAQAIERAANGLSDLRQTTYLADPTVKGLSSPRLCVIDASSGNGILIYEREKVILHICEVEVCALMEFLQKRYAEVATRETA